MNPGKADPSRPRLYVPPGALLILGLMEAAVVVTLTWPSRNLVVCEQMPELVALAVCAAVLFVVSARSLSQPREGRLLSGAATVLAALAVFVSVHYVRTWYGPCRAVQHQTQHPAQPEPEHK